MAGASNDRLYWLRVLRAGFRRSTTGLLFVDDRRTLWFVTCKGIIIKKICLNLQNNWYLNFLTTLIYFKYVWDWYFQNRSNYGNIFITNIIFMNTKRLQQPGYNFLHIGSQSTQIHKLIQLNELLISSMILGRYKDKLNSTVIWTKFLPLNTSKCSGIDFKCCHKRPNIFDGRVWLVKPIEDRYFQPSKG